ncbi:MAG: hypothetical protein PHU63_02270 [Candidatus ainarchaeum sp.]|nr:hypothetical protein [Candidatus ainarchaeum sp.]
MIDLFLRRKTSKLLICLKNTEKEWTLNTLCKESGMTYVYLMKLIPKLEKFSLISKEKKGKRNILKLTDKGMQLASLLENIERMNVDLKNTGIPQDDLNSKQKTNSTV